MSFRLQKLGWDAPINAPEKIVLLRLIDHADDEGASIFPSVASVAAACGCSGRSVQRAIARFVEIGILILVKEADYRTRRPREYRLDIASLAKMAKTPEEPVTHSHWCRTDAPPVPHSREPVTDGREPVSHGHPEPTNEPIKEPTRGAAAAQAERYAWNGRVIKLKESDYTNWKRAYPKIPDFDAELAAADAYYADNAPKNGKWWFQVSNWLKRANETAIERQPIVEDVLTAAGRLYRTIGVH